MKKRDNKPMKCNIKLETITGIEEELYSAQRIIRHIGSIQTDQPNGHQNLEAAISDARTAADTIDHVLDVLAASEVQEV